jgi:D-alanyl-D-alanine carboxypeptidase
MTPYFGTPAGGGYSTIDDLLAFARAIRTKHLLDAKHTELLTVGRADTGKGLHFLGLCLRSRNGEPCYGHGGSALEVPPASMEISRFILGRGT